MGHERSLQSILFTDIVGSTRRATELGDRGWTELLEEHHHRARREIRRFGGREIKALGDGFLVSFARPSQAIRCAWTIRESMRELGLEVRAGVHVGEVEHHAGDLSGIAVHICSRISARAAPSEILVSQAVREMGTGAGFRFRDYGEHELEGLAGKWRLHELRSLPAGTASLRTGRWIPELNGRQLGFGLAVAAFILSTAFVLWYVDANRAPTLPDGGEAGSAEPAIAVLPFTVNDPHLEAWSEGLVTLLSTGLDGAAGLRAIDSPTVLAQWDRMVDQEFAPGLARSLDVARATGARYALVGSATAIGPSLRIVGDLYRTEGGERIGQVQTQGSEEEVLDMVDGLAIDVLRLILEKSADDLAKIDLASVTTSSLPALKSFLEGHTLYRRADFGGAAEAFERAVVADTLFALAYHHLALAYGWEIPAKWERFVDAAETADRLKARLPRREATFAVALLAVTRRTIEGLEEVREATRRYPDDAEGWFHLGEYYYHVPQALGSLDEAEAAFRRASEILPDFAPYRIHLVDLAFTNAPDSTRVARELEEYRALTLPSNGERRGFELAFALAFGDESVRGRTMAALDTVSEAIQREVRDDALRHPRFFEDRRILLGDRFPGARRHGQLYQRGHLGEAVLTAEGPWLPCVLGEAHAFGIPVDPETLRAELTLTAADSTPGPRTACGGFYALDGGRKGDHARAVAIHRRAASQAIAEGDTAAARFEGEIVNGLEGYARWKGGDRDGALSLLQESFREQGYRLWALWIGQILLELDRPEEAVPYFRSVRFNPLADYYLGTALERSGQLEEARRAYESLVLYWRDPDPELRPLVERSRQAMIRVGGLRRE